MRSGSLYITFLFFSIFYAVTSISKYVETGLFFRILIIKIFLTKPSSGAAWVNDGEGSLVNRRYFMGANWFL